MRTNFTHAEGLHAGVATGSLTGVLDALDSDLADVGRRCGPLQQNSRFFVYRRVVEQTVRSGIEGQKFPLLWEAIGQAYQLRLGSSLWPFLEESILVEKLSHIMAGTPLPPSNPDHDAARNYLAELTTAAIMYSQGLDVRVTRYEDLSVSATSLSPNLESPAPFAVECKRPASAAGLEKAARRVRSQIQARVEAGYDHGIAVFVVDRLMWGYGQTVATSSGEEFAATSKDLLDQAASLLISILAKSKHHLHSRTALVAVLFSGVAIQDNPTQFFARTHLMPIPPLRSPPATQVLLDRLSRPVPERPLRGF